MADARLPFTQVVRELPSTTPFVGPEAIERQRGFTFRARLGANESNFGVSPKALAAMREEAARACWYGDSENHDLRNALAARLGVQPEHICVGGGIDELLGILVRVLVAPGTPVVTSDGAYPTFNYHVNGYGGVLHKVPYRDDHEDLEGLLAKARELKPPLVYLSNPDNPMGNWHPAEAVREFIAALPEGTVLVLDEAYAEFGPDAAVPPFEPDDPRVVRMRTFSKVYGMAGQRIGHAVAHPEMITAFNKVRNHFGVNRIAQVGALAALEDEAFVREVLAEVQQGREDYARLAERLGFQALPSATNFVTIDVGGGKRARWLLQALQDERVFIRMPGVPPLDRCIRVTVGPPDERAIFAEVLEKLAARLPAEDEIRG